jgi:hypothetical protein
MAMRFLIPCLSLAACLLAGGCATPPFPERPVLPEDGRNPAALRRASQTLAQLFPQRYSAMQRALITAGGKQFTCDAWLTASPAEGHHLAIVSSFGTVTDLRIRPDGRTELLKVTPLFRADWSQRFVARDLRWLFIPPTQLASPGWLADGRLVWRTAPDATGTAGEYIFSADGARWEELDLQARGQTFYRAVARHYLTFPGMTTATPDQFDVSAESYRLELRLAALKPEAHP